jgi:hypothetical protein
VRKVQLFEDRGPVHLSRRSTVTTIAIGLATVERSEAWRYVFRNGFAPGISDEGLRTLLWGLENDDPRLIQGATTSPPPLMCVMDWPVEAACALGYVSWLGDGCELVGDVQEEFSRACFEADQRLGEPAGCRHYLNWFDDTPRDIVRRLLTQEVKRELNGRSDAPIVHDLGGEA